MSGIPDGDINYPSLCIDDVDDCYIQDDTFSELMGTFLKIMSSAKKEGGLYCDGVCSEE